MAKLFYSLDEAAAKLKMTPDKVKELVDRGQLQEFRDRDRLMFRVEQVDVLAGGEDEGVIPLSGSGEHGAISLASDSGSGLNLESPKEQSGISIFDADSTDDADPSAQTHVADTGTTDFALETASSGSGLLDMTRPEGDTSLGAEFLEDAYSGQQAGAPAAGGPLFESAAGDAEAAAVGGGVLFAAEPFDGPGSGMAGGLALGVIVSLALTMIIIVGGMTGGFTGLVTMVGGNFWAFVGGLVGALVLFALVGWALGRKS